MHSTGIQKMRVKIKKQFFHFHFDTAARVFVINNWTQDTILSQSFLSTLYLFESVFSGVVWTNRLHDLDEGIFFLTTVAMEIGKIHFFNNQWKMFQEEKYLIKNMNLTDAHFDWKNWVDRILDTWWDKTPCNLKNVYFEKKSLKNK